MRTVAALLLATTLAAGSDEQVKRIVAEYDRMSAMALWPGFEPAKTPLAIYDGERTHMFRHPRLGSRVIDGRHGAVVANSSAELDGVVTATLMASAERSPAADAAVLIHEAFHVYQRSSHPAWMANEASYFTYPEEPNLLAVGRWETEVLRRALADKDPACSSAAFVGVRRSRYASMPGEAAAYERGTELNEGLANYVQDLASGRSETAIPEGGLNEADPRQRGYMTGAAIAHLLDRVAPGWKGKVTNSLDGLLPSPEGGGAACEPTAAENERLTSWARQRYADLTADRARHKREFLSKPGWTLVISSAKPLFPQGFDPMNVERVTDGEVLHRRFVKLGNEAGSLEVMDRASLTEAAGEHPLFEGVRSCTISGFPEEPKLGMRNGGVSFSGSGVTLSFAAARVQKAERRVTVVLE